MKRFIVRSALFALLVVAVFGSICFFELRYELRSYKTELKAPPDADILVCNDSQTEMAIDPSVEPRFFNFSLPGRTMDQTYLACLDLYRENRGKFRLMLIDISPATAIDTFDQPIPKMGYASQYYLLHWLHRRENVRDMTGELAVFRDNMVGRRWRLFWRSLRGRAKFKSSIGGGFNPVLSALAKESPDDFSGQWQARSRHVNSQPAITENSPIFRHVDEIVRLSREYGVVPILITTPWHPALRNACDSQKLAEFGKVVSTHAGKLGCQYVNLFTEEFPDDCWYDAQHFNFRGAKAFTPVLTRRLQERGLLQQRN